MIVCALRHGMNLDSQGAKAIDMCGGSHDSSLLAHHMHSPQHHHLLPVAHPSFLIEVLHGKQLAVDCNTVSASVIGLQPRYHCLHAGNEQSTSRECHETDAR